MFEKYPDIMSIQEVCEALRLGYNAAYDLVNSGKLKGFKNGRVWRIPKKAVIQYVTESSKL